MKVFIDTNVILDFITGRQGVEEASGILQAGEEGRVTLCVSLLTMANTAYVARRGRTREELYELLSLLAQMLCILSMDEAQFAQALQRPARDFEDILQSVCAQHHQCDCIITRNKKDFPLSSIPVLSPQEFLQTLERHNDAL